MVASKRSDSNSEECEVNQAPDSDMRCTFLGDIAVNVPTLGTWGT